MKSLARLSLAAALGTFATPVLADAAVCTAGIATYAKAPNGLNFEPPRKYDTEKLARTRAIAAWRADVSAQCPHYSNLWWRAHDKAIACEGYAGGIGCDIKGTPARKLY